MDMKQLIWHGDIEIALDKRRPLFATIIYDSCRDQLPQSVKQWVKGGKFQNQIYCFQLHSWPVTGRFILLHTPYN